MLKISNKHGPHGSRQSNMTQRTDGMGYGMGMDAREADPIQSFEEAGWAPNRRHRWGRRHRLDHGTRRRRGGGRHGNIAAGRQVDQSLPHHDLLLRGDDLSIHLMHLYLNTPLFFLSAFPMFVLSLSWQNDRFY